MDLQCKICNKTFDTIKGLSNHIKKHKITKKEYYDKFYKKSNDGICKTCGKSTKFQTLSDGYGDYCSNRCIINNKEVQQKRLSAINKENLSKVIKEGLKKSNKSSKKTKLDRYSDENYNNRDKARQTYLNKYNVDNPAKSELVKKRIKQTFIKNGYQVDESQEANFLLFSKNIRKETKKNKKILFDNWDGVDFYDKEYIKENLNLNFNNRNYPTIDHKISILDGFLLGYNYIDIASLDNLCITKKWINSSKYSKGDYNVK